MRAMRVIRRLTGTLALCIGFVLACPQVEAGIIITEGKIADELEVEAGKSKSSRRKGTTGKRRTPTRGHA